MLQLLRRAAFQIWMRCCCWFVCLRVKPQTPHPDAKHCCGAASCKVTVLKGDRKKL